MNDQWPEIENALVAFTDEFYLEPIIIYYTPGGYIEQDMKDGCGDVCDMFGLDNPQQGLWVWEGSFNSKYEGGWREPSDEEWILILQQTNPWK